MKNMRSVYWRAALVALLTIVAFRVAKHIVLSISSDSTNRSVSNFAHSPTGWVLLHKDTVYGYAYYYDPDSVVDANGSGIFRVAVMIAVDSSIKTKVKEILDASGIEYLYEIDCPDRRARILSYTISAKDGTTIKSPESLTPSGWIQIDEDTLPYWLYMVICQNNKAIVE